MDRKFHRREYNHVLSETVALDPRFKKLACSDARAIEALQRITSAAGRDSPSWLRHQGNWKKRDQMEQKHQQ